MAEEREDREVREPEVRREAEMRPLPVEPEAAAAENKHLEDANIAPGGLSFGYIPQDHPEASAPVGKFDAEYVTFLTSQTPVRLSHGLGRVPRGWVMVHHDHNAAVHLWKGTTAWNDKEIFLDSDIDDATVTVMLM